MLCVTFSLGRFLGDILDSGRRKMQIMHMSLPSVLPSAVDLVLSTARGNVKNIKVLLHHYCICIQIVFSLETYVLIFCSFCAWPVSLELPMLSWDIIVSNIHWNENFRQCHSWIFYRLDSYAFTQPTVPTVNCTPSFLCLSLIQI